MKLTRADAVNLNNILQAAALAGVESIVIDTDGIASGLNQKNSCFITKNDVPKFPQKVGIGEIKKLRERLELFINNPDCVLEARESERGEIASLEIAAGRNKAQYRCRASALIKAPKGIDDAPIVLITMDKEQVGLLLNSVRVMGAKQVTLIVRKDGETSFEAADSNNDRVTVSLTKPAERIGGDDEDELGTVVHYYSTDTLGSLLRAATGDDGVSFGVGQAGTIQLVVQDHQMFIFSQIDGD